VEGPAPHTPVLPEQVIGLLSVREEGVYVDATVGFGGHAASILSRLGPGGRIVGIDRDPEALAWCRERLGNNRVFLAQGRFSQMEDVVKGLGFPAVDGVLLDLGVSMHQLKRPSRGFSFSSEARLDMRMDPGESLTAWDVVNTYDERALEKVLADYGEEHRSKRIARAIVLQREKKHIETCIELAELILSVCRRHGRAHPATKTFQALRIEVNGELDELRKALRSGLGLLNRGGKLCVVSYHSLEDRIVKNFMRDHARSGQLRLLTKKPVAPQRDEVRWNPSSRSAKLRGAEKI